MNRALGIDLGDARVGVAVTDDIGMLAHPLETIQVKSGNVAQRVAQLAKDRQAATVVVGMPRNMDGTYGPAAEKAREFIDALKLACPCRIVPWDERLSTVAAQRSLHELSLIHI